MTIKVGGIEFDVTVDSSSAVTAATKIVKSNSDIEESFEAVEHAAKRLPSALSRISNQYSQGSSKLKEFIAQQIEAGRSFDENGNVVTAYGVKAKNLTEQFEKLKRQFLDTKASSDKVEEAFRGITAETKQAYTATKEAAEATNKYTYSQQGFVGPIQRTAEAAQKSTKSLINMRHAAGQLGFQVQDAAVQLQMGTNALVVLGQQGSQIAGIFGPTGAIVGGVLAVGAALAGVLVPQLMSSGDEAEELSEKLKELQKDSKLTADQSAYLALKKEEEAEKTKKAVEEINDEIKEKQALVDKNKELIETGRSLSALRKGQSATGRIESLKAENAELEKRLKYLRAQRDTESGKTGGKKFDAEANKEAILSYRDRIVAIQSAMDQESAIVTNSLKYRAGVEAGIFSEQEAALKERQENQIVNEKVAFANKLQMLNEQRESLLENEALTETQRKELMSQFNVMETQARYTHQQKLTDIDEQAAEARKNIAEKERRAKIAALSGTFGALSSLMNTESRKLFEIGKAAAVANAIVNTFDAIQTARASAPPPLNYALAAAEAVAGAANVAGIMRTSFGSKSAGQSFQQGRLTTNTSQQQPQQRSVSIALTGSSFSGGDIRGLISAINEELGDGVTLSATGG